MLHWRLKLPMVVGVAIVVASVVGRFACGGFFWS